MKYNPNQIEANWQKYWAENQTFAAQNPSSPPLEGLGEDKPKYYVLDMFPYPSGAGLHVGHPLGYIASDIVARFKRHKGFNVLHPQGYDSFGLPAEQYAIQTGQHPDKTTKENIARYREQLDKIGFSFDWSREVRTSNADYYKHTQWIFIQLFNSWYNKLTDKAEDISSLITIFEMAGNATVHAVSDDNVEIFFPSDWRFYSEEKKQQILLQYRLTYLAETEVNWCPGLGTVLANDEIVNGVSERGGHPVIRKKMTQWSMRISAYAERLLQGLDTIDWSESIKESQRNWIGKSVGAMVSFKVLTPALSKGEGANIDLDTDDRNLKRDPRYMTGDSQTASILLNHAKEMRKEPTLEEAILWDELRNRKLEDKFRRQHLIGKYIVDFVCLERKLIIEVDGAYHNSIEQTELDQERTLELEQKHLFKVVRFTNEEIKFEISKVLSKIKEELSSPQPSPKERELKEPAPSPLERAGVRNIEVFTTRPDTIFGVTFMTLAPEHPLVQEITTDECRQNINEYIEKTAKRSERERMADVKTISGVFTGAFAEHPFTKEPIPVWIGDYVLAGYGTGAVMAVPCGDERDYAFANFFKGKAGMPEIKNIFEGIDISTEANGSKDNVIIANSDFLNGLNYKEATKKAIEELEKIKQGKGKINYRLRDAVFSRQRYWGEPFPVYYVNGLPQMIDAKHLPIKLPEVEKYLPTEDGQPPLGNATVWAWNIETNEVVSSSAVENKTIFPLELNTMPGWAGSSWYWMRYMDAHNENEFASKEALDYWQNVDLYIGGSEHATGHLLYSRFWNKFLKDKGFAPTEEPFKKLINQGMILGMSAFVYRVFCLTSNFGKHTGNFDDNAAKSIFTSNILVSKKIASELDKDGVNEYFIDTDLHSKINNLLIEQINIANLNLSENDTKYGTEISSFKTTPIHVDLSVINDITNELNIEAFKKHPLYSDYKDAEFITEENEKYIVGREIEKMSKSKYNVVNPDDICNEYGADTLRLYEMFLGPLEQAKPWNTAGITGVFGFLKKLWRLYFDDNGLIITNNEPSKESLKSLHKTIKKVTEDIEDFSFNTSVSQFMICVNELQTQNCHEIAILEPLAILISPYAPHIAEELWFRLKDSKIEELKDYKGISEEAFPIYDEKYLVESDKEYPVSFNGKMRFTINLPLDLTPVQIEEIIMKDERTIKQLDGNMPKKIIIVPGKVINLVG
ncbi:leucine--tRNA ligase [Flavobacterium sp.]|uniref:leucine--tRNA ligase n=1 Tax=Flavobacterium sp. TaxID=239 RepID=UPI003750991A